MIPYLNNNSNTQKNLLYGQKEQIELFFLGLTSFSLNFLLKSVDLFCHICYVLLKGEKI